MLIISALCEKVNTIWFSAVSYTCITPVFLFDMHKFYFAIMYIFYNKKNRYLFSYDIIIEERNDYYDHYPNWDKL